MPAEVADRDVTDMFAAAEGDAAALGELYDRHAPTLLDIGQRILRNRREAEDLLHDVFVEVWRHAGDYDPARGSVRAWLRLRMRSRALDRVRSPRVSRARQLDEAAHAKLSGGENPERAADGSTLHSALAQLPDEQRMVLSLGYFEGMSCSEIATKIGVPIGTVKSRVAAAMRKLRAHFKQKTQLEPKKERER
jgi:RNA polymerase sigma-70 factor (ECF subfamily)